MREKGSKFVIDEITDFVLDWADGFGLIGLAIVSCTEAAFQPVPPDLLVMPIFLRVTFTVALPLVFDKPLNTTSFPLFVIVTWSDVNGSTLPSV